MSTHLCWFLTGPSRLSYSQRGWLRSEPVPPLSLEREEAHGPGGSHAFWHSLALGQWSSLRRS
jgi:hypothetical protein